MEDGRAIYEPIGPISILLRRNAISRWSKLHVVYECKIFKAEYKPRDVGVVQRELHALLLGRVGNLLGTV
jgi:hypothetical protein